MAVSTLEEIKLSDVCVYTIIAEENLMKHTAFLRENQRWVAVQKKHLPNALRDGLQLPIVFADARQCIDLMAWSTLQQVRLSDRTTEFAIGDLFSVGTIVREDLILLRKGQPISDGDIRPYHLCATPQRLKVLARQPRRWKKLPNSE